MKTSDGLYVALSFGLPLIVVCCAIAAMLDMLGLTDTDVEAIGLFAALALIWWDCRKPDGEP